MSIFQHKENARNALSISDGKKIIGFVSRFEEKKGWEVFIQMCFNLKKESEQYIFIMIGEGTQESQLRNLVKKLNLENDILILSMKSQKQLSLYYSLFDVMCFPTYRKSESLGLVGIEAMACKTIVVASNIGGPSSYIENEINGFLFIPKDISDLTEKVKTALSLKDEEKRKMLNNAYNTAKLFSVEKIQKDFVEYFNELIDKE